MKIFNEKHLLGQSITAQLYSILPNNVVVQKELVCGNHCRSIFLIMNKYMATSNKMENEWKN